MDQPPNHMLPPLQDKPSSSPNAPPPYAITPDPSAGAALPPFQPAAKHESSLPSLSLLTRTDFPRDPPAMSSPPAPSAPSVPPAPLNTQHWPSLNPLTQFYTPSHLQPSPVTSPARTDVESPGESRRCNSISLDDPDVRMAAEALGDLRAFTSSPKQKHTPLHSSASFAKSHASGSSASSGSATPQLSQAEPLLSLLTTAHPVIATTIEGATAAYTSGKNYSPRFKSGAEYVEGFVTPVANTVGSVGRVTGVEGGIRWYLRKAARGRRSKTAKDQDVGDGHKRRKVGNDASSAVANQPSSTDGRGPDPEHRLSIGTIDTLPAYDDVRSPEYTEVVEGAAPPALKTRLFMSTSGLSVAMSEESLKSLKYCLRWLRWANEHISHIIENLKVVLEQYDSKVASPEQMEEGQLAREKILLAERIAALKNDVLKTLQDAIQTVSKYAGGALPENARELVRSQLTSLPRRFCLAQERQGPLLPTVSQSAQPEARAPAERILSPGAPEIAVQEGAQRVLILAKEGLDMMAQVSQVLDGTIVSAEEWCEKLGRKRRADGDGRSSDDKRSLAEAPLPRSEDTDVVMSG